MSDVVPFPIRHLVTQSEFRACVAFQKQIWGENFGDVVPAAILWVAHRTGGLVAAAFDDRGDMAGFVFGVAGIDERGPFHWSDMLAVRENLRGRGLGRALKAFQRNELLRRGITRCHWTFDPLESANAWFNFAVLGATCSEYVPDCYGESTSPLHAGLPTDRMVLRWELDSARVRQRMEDSGRPHAPPAPAQHGDIVRVSVPAGMQQLKRTNPERAIQWRMETREAFLSHFGEGYRVEEVVREANGGVGYLLSR